MKTRCKRSASGGLIVGYKLHLPGTLSRVDQYVTEERAREVAALGGPVIGQRVVRISGEEIYEDLSLYPE